MTRRIRDIALGISIAYLAFLPQFYTMYDRENRFFVGWMRDDSIGLLVGLFVWGGLAGLAILTGRWLASKHSRSKPFVAAGLNVLLWLVLTRTVVSLIVRSHPESSSVEWLDGRAFKFALYIGVPVIVSLVRKGQVIRPLATIYRIIWPAWVLLCIQLVLWGGVSKADASVAQVRESSRERGDIYIFLFDEWSFERTFSEDGTLTTDMPNLKGLLPKCTLFTRAYAPGADSVFSITRFLYQDESSEGMSFDVLKDTWLPGYHADAPTFFDMLDPARERSRIAVGFGFNYPVMYSNHTDVAFSVGPCVGGMDVGLMGKTQIYVMSQLAWLKRIPWISEKTKDALFSPIVKEYAYEVVLAMFEDTIDLDRGSVFGLFHFPIPHMPFTWKDGKRLARLPKGAGEHTVENYMENLRGLDYVIGRIVDKLQAEDRYDEALFIMMADHNWRFDPELAAKDMEHYSCGLPGRYFDDMKMHRLRHVPVMVKWPGQHVGTLETNTIFTVKLSDIVLKK